MHVMKLGSAFSNSKDVPYLHCYVHSTYCVPVVQYYLSSDWSTNCVLIPSQIQTIHMQKALPCTRAHIYSYLSMQACHDHATIASHGLVHCNLLQWQ